jgi:2-phosphosulfolactate phosphatase
VKTIEVCLSPDLAKHYNIKDKAVVIIDILRATSCWITALANGAHSVTPVERIEECLEYKKKGYLGSAERQGQKLEGFDLGNSPFDFMSETVKGRKIAATTTNGSGNVNRFRKAGKILAGGFLNASSLVDTVARMSSPLILSCSGWEGGISLEDTLFAGMVICRLPKDWVIFDDSAAIAENLWNTQGKNFRRWLEQSSHVKRLLHLGLKKDIDFCFDMDRYSIVPSLKNGDFTI